jgi:hypothetical protein
VLSVAVFSAVHARGEQGWESAETSNLQILTTEQHPRRASGVTGTQE